MNIFQDFQQGVLRGAEGYRGVLRGTRGAERIPKGDERYGGVLRDMEEC